MLIKCLPVGHLMTNCYIVTDETTLECAVIDPGDESNTILYYLEDNHLTCRAILLTHGHYDHTGAVYAVHEETGAPVYMNALDAGTAVAFDSYTFTPPEGTIFYKEGDEVKVGNLTFRVMETPGHTPGGVTLICGDALFTGDTLFAGSCGRTDFAGGSMEVELQSLAKIAALPGDYEVYPGHMDCSTLETERRFNPYLTEADPYRGAYMAVVESVTKLVCAGFHHEDMYLTFQEYFEHMNDKPERWGKPLAALLGALDAQMGLGIASIGGKDSMSGSFEGLDVPPTLVSFATAIGNTRDVQSPEFKKANSSVVILRPNYKNGLPEIGSLIAIYKTVEQMIDEGKVLAAATPGYGGVAEALFKMCVGNHVGLQLSNDIDLNDLFKPAYGAVILELLDASAGEFLGFTTVDYTLEAEGKAIDLARLQELWEQKLEPVFPYRKAGEFVPALEHDCPANKRVAPSVRLATPRVVIPVFPGTNCEYDTARAFRRAGGDPHVLVLKNLTPANVAESCEALVKELDEAQILMLPGGFSGGDEPDGSAKFIAAFFRNPSVADAVNRLLNQRDGLALGICNGFQALIKLGLVPYGEIRPITESDPTLTFNTIHRHQSMLVRTRVASNKSPWLSKCDINDEHLIAISHGEGRFVCNEQLLNQLIDNGQIATQYVDLLCRPTMDMRYNPNGSVLAIEGITSPDGRVFGKMGHSERSGEQLYKNVTGDKYQPIFEGGVNYFKL